MTAASWLSRKGHALLRYGPGFAIEVLIFWVVLETFQQLNYGGRIITTPQSRTALLLSVAAFTCILYRVRPQQPICEIALAAIAWVRTAIF